MSEQTFIILDKLFEGDRTDRGRVIREELVNTYNQYLEDPGKQLRKVAMTNAFFKAFSHILKKRLPKEGYSLQLTTTELNFIDYGYVFPDLIPMPVAEVETMLGQLQWNTGSSDYLRFFSFSGYINHEFHRFMGYFELQELNKAIDQLKYEYQEIDQDKKIIVEHIRQMNIENYDTPQKAQVLQTLHTLNNNVYRLTEALISLKKRVQTGQALTAEERTQLINIENKQNQLKRERNNLYKETQLEHKLYIEINNLEEKYFKRINDAQDKYHEIERAIRNRDTFSQSKLEMPLIEKEDFIQDKVKEIQNLIDYTAKRSRVAPFPFLTRRVVLDLPEQIFNYIRGCEKHDQQLFKTKGVRLQGMPGVILGPGQGEGFFNYENNKFFIPVEYSNSLEDSVIHALVIYKWDMDETREMRDSFAELKPYKGKSFVELQKGLYKEYHTYITKESRGYKVMDKEIKEWFSWKISPSKEDLEAFDANSGPASALNGDGIPLVNTIEGEVIDVDDTPATEEAVPVEPGELYTPVPAASRAEDTLNEFYQRLVKLLRWPDLRERIRITPAEEQGDVDITIQGIDLSGMEAEEIFQSLLIQAKLRRLRGLEKHRWFEPPEDAVGE